MFTNPKALTALCLPFFRSYTLKKGQLERDYAQVRDTKTCGDGSVLCYNQSNIQLKRCCQVAEGAVILTVEHNCGAH